jgi:integrase
MRALKPTCNVDQPKPFNGTSKAWKRLLAAAKISERTTIHDLRRTYCTSMIEAGAPLPYVAQAMGHRDMSTTQKHYAIARQDHVRQAVYAGVAGMLAAAKEASKQN